MNKSVDIFWKMHIMKMTLIKRFIKVIYQCRGVYYFLWILLGFLRGTESEKFIYRKQNCKFIAGIEKKPSDFDGETGFSSECQ